MVWLDISTRVDTHCLGQPEKPGMLAGTVVVKTAGNFIRQDQFGGVFHALWPLRTAFQVILAEPGLRSMTLAA